jgi:hypothetical protein
MKEIIHQLWPIIVIIILGCSLLLWDCIKSKL